VGVGRRPGSGGLDVGWTFGSSKRSGSGSIGVWRESPVIILLGFGSEITLWHDETDRDCRAQRRHPSSVRHGYLSAAPSCVVALLSTSCCYSRKCIRPDLRLHQKLAQTYGNRSGLARPGIGRCRRWRTGDSCRFKLHRSLVPAPRIPDQPHSRVR